MAANTEFSVANLEFDTIKSNLQTFLEGQAVFADYNFAGSSLNVLLDVLAYNTYYNNVYLNHVATEMFLDSAQLRDSVYSIAKTLNYLPRSYRSAVGFVNINVNPSSNPHQITIPRLTSFTSTIGDNTYTFSTNTDITVYSNNSYLASNVAIYEGEIVQEAFLVSNTSPNTQQMYINNFDVDLTSLTVKVRTSNTDSTNSEYTRANSLFSLSGTSNVYFVEPSTNGSYKVVFGNGLFGRQLSNNNLVELTYRVSSGTDPNGANNFTAASVAGHDAAISLVTRATNGAVNQTLDDIKFAAPRALAVQERAVTKQDYITITQNEFNDVSSMHVYDGADEPVPQFGVVKLAVRSSSYDVLPSALKTQIINFLKPKMPIGIRSEVIDPDFINVVLDTTVKFDKNDTQKTLGQIQTLTSTTVDTFNTDNLDKFDSTFRKSKLIEKINETDGSIVSNEVRVRMTKDIGPQGMVPYTKTLEFNNALKADNPVDETSQDAFISLSTPAITSESFVFNNINGAFLRDNGGGALQVVTASNTDLVVLSSNVGTVDYTTGSVSLQGLTINSYSTGATSGTLKVYAVPKDDDVSGARNDVVRIRTADTTVTVTELRL